MTETPKISPCIKQGLQDREMVMLRIKWGMDGKMMDHELINPVAWPAMDVREEMPHFQFQISPKNATETNH